MMENSELSDSFYLPPVSGPATIGSYIFNVAGTYDYDCSIGSHAANGMPAVSPPANASSDS